MLCGCQAACSHEPCLPGCFLGPFLALPAPSHIHPRMVNPPAGISLPPGRTPPKCHTLTIRRASASTSPYASTVRTRSVALTHYMCTHMYEITNTHARTRAHARTHVRTHARSHHHTLNPAHTRTQTHVRTRGLPSPGGGGEGGNGPINPPPESRLPCFHAFLARSRRCCHCFRRCYGDNLVFRHGLPFEKTPAPRQVTAPRPRVHARGHISRHTRPSRPGMNRVQFPACARTGVPPGSHPPTSPTSRILEVQAGTYPE